MVSEALDCRGTVRVRSQVVLVCARVGRTQASRAMHVTARKDVILHPTRLVAEKFRDRDESNYCRLLLVHLGMHVKMHVVLFADLFQRGFGSHGS